MFHPTIKLTTEYPKEEASFLDLNIKLIRVELKTFICLTYTYLTYSSVFRSNLSSFSLQ